MDNDIGDRRFQWVSNRRVAGNPGFLDFPSEAKCRAAASAMEASERVSIATARPGQTNNSPPAYYRIVAHCVER